jgi:hypothetical protein
MTSQTQTKPSILRQEDLVALGIGVATGILSGLVLLGLVLDSGLRRDSSLLNGLTTFVKWMAPWLRQVLTNEATLMGWPLNAETSAYWYMSRGAGLVGYLLLWGATAWGLIVNTKIAKGVVAAPFATDLHQFLSLGALAFAGFHALVLLGDHYIDFGLTSVVYPFAASYRPIWVGLGQLGFYLSAVLILSFYFRKKIGHKVWRSLHYFTFLAYSMVLVHGLTSGTDATLLPVTAMYVGTGATVSFLIYYRLLTTGQRRTA